MIVILSHYPTVQRVIVIAQLAMLIVLSVDTGALIVAEILQMLPLESPTIV